MDLAEIVLYIHITVAIMSVTAGTGSILFKKAHFMHKETGKIYFYAMIATVATAFVLLMFPGYGNPIMIFIGIFMLYLTISGYRSLKFKVIFSSEKVPAFDKIISGIMGAASMGMMIHGSYILSGGDMWGLPLIIYGIAGIINVIQDFSMFRSISPDGFKWMKYHASKMIGSYIGAITAILVTQYSDSLGIYAWFLTMLFGLAYMAYWIKKIKTNPTSVFDW